VIPFNNAQSLYSGRSSNIPIILLSGADYVFSASTYEPEATRIFMLLFFFVQIEYLQLNAYHQRSILRGHDLKFHKIDLQILIKLRCFLSEDTKPVAVIIENILQCALDFGLHLTGGRLYAGTNRPDPLNLQSDINLCKVLAYFSH
ncbi:hypothetical protein B296_00026595, partial [Ensete ventricosum]